MQLELSLNTLKLKVYNEPYNKHFKTLANVPFNCLEFHYIHHNLANESVDVS